MRKLFITLMFMAFAGSTAIAQDMHQKTYYDADKTLPKEVYAVKEVIIMDPSNPSNSRVNHVKEGPYFYYYENGKLKIKGEYKNDLKSGEWKYYDETGKLTSSERYDKGKLIP